MLHINDIESRDGRVEPDICLGDRAAMVVRSVLDPGQVLLYPIKGFEELNHGFLVRFLCRCEAGTVDAVVDIVVCPLVRLLDLLPQSFREEVHALVLLREEIIKLEYDQLAPMSRTRLRTNIPRYKAS